MNVISIARGKNVWRSSERIVYRFTVTGCGDLLITAGHRFYRFSAACSTTRTGHHQVIFECISAFSTVGLSLGITADLNTASKWVIILTMFIGRVGTLTLFVALFRKVKTLNYRYPTDPS